MEIRFAAPRDIPGIIDLLKQVGQVHHLGRPDIFRAGAQKYDEQQVLAMLDKPTDPIFVACEDGKVLELRVAEGDMGKVIGRQGRIAKEIRTIVKTVAQRTGEKVTVEIVD